MTSHEGYLSDAVAVPCGPPVSHGPTAADASDDNATVLPANKFDAPSSCEASELADVQISSGREYDNDQHRPADVTNHATVDGDALSPHRQELLRSLQQVLGEEEFTKLSPDLLDLGTDSLERLLAEQSCRPNADSNCNPKESAPTHDPDGDNSIREQLLKLIRAALGEEEYNKHAPQLMGLGTDSLRNLLDGLGVDTAHISPGSKGNFDEEASPSPVMPADLADARIREPTLALITKASSQRQRQGESQAQFLGRLTHLHLVNKKLSVLGDILHNSCAQLRVLYLSENRFHTLGLLPTGLESLFLQENELWEMDSWSNKLPNLSILNLNENRMSLLHGLKRSSCLQELTMRGQRGSRLDFDAGTLRIICQSLRVLDVSQNQLTDLTPLACLSRLQRLDASQNELASVSMVAPVLRNASDLRHLKLERNPLCSKGRYRDDVVLLAHSLEELDGRSVGRGEHIFLQELNQRRQHRNKNKRTPSAPPAMEGGRNQMAQAENQRLEGMASAMPVQAGRRNGKKNALVRRAVSEDRSRLPSDAADEPYRAAGRFKANAEPGVSSSRLPPLLPATDRKVDAAFTSRGYRQRKIDMA